MGTVFDKFGNKFYTIFSMPVTQLAQVAGKYLLIILVVVRTFEIAPGLHSLGTCFDWSQWFHIGVLDFLGDI